jgi:TetR/AcrR family transcriptional regulator, cholesterol catabolism regulator
MSKERWEEIINVSARLFSEKDYRATTLDDIAAELGITKAALYYYIKSKHDILYAICKTAINQYRQGVEEIVEAERSSQERMRDIIYLNVNIFSRSGDIINVYLSEENKLPPAKKRYITKQRREIERIIRGLFEQAIEEGVFRELDVPMVTRAIFGMTNWLSKWYRKSGEYSADEIARIFCDLIMRGCLNDEFRGEMIV